MSRVESQYVVSPIALSDGQFAYALCDVNGRLVTSEQFAPQAEDNANGVIAHAIKPLVGSMYAATLYTNFAAAVTQNMKALGGNLFSFMCRNANAANRWIQFHDTATTPAGGAVPKLTFLLGPTSVLAVGREFFGPMGLFFTNGIAMAFSTTEATYTAGAAADVTLQATYK